MARTISANARSQIQATETQDVILVVLDINHSSLANPIRVVNNNQNIVYNGNTYLASSFRFTPPAQEEGELRRATLSISNVDRSLITLVRSITTSPTVTANVVFVGATVEREAGPWDFDLFDVSYNAETITGTLVYNFKPKQTLSTVRVTFRDFPSLVQVQ